MLYYLTYLNIKIYFCWLVWFFKPQSIIFLVMLRWVFLGWNSTKQRIKCLAQGHNTVTLLVVRYEQATLWSPVKYYTNWATALHWYTIVLLFLIQKDFTLLNGMSLQGSNLALANLLNASSFLQKASRNCHHLLLLASENKSFLYQPNYATQHKLYGKQCRSWWASFWSWSGSTLFAKNFKPKYWFRKMKMINSYCQSIYMVWFT